MHTPGVCGRLLGTHSFNPEGTPLASPTPTVTDLDTQTLREWMNRHQDLIVIDVRSAAEFQTLHIRGSYNIPLPLLSEHADELAERLRGRVVLVCQSGVRAEQARTRLGGAGLGTALVLTAAFRASPPPAGTWCAAPSAGTWSARCAWLPAPSWSPASSPAGSSPPSCASSPAPSAPA